jgi:hypothetical protein
MGYTPFRVGIGWENKTYANRVGGGEEKTKLKLRQHLAKPPCYGIIAK